MYFFNNMSAWSCTDSTFRSHFLICLTPCADTWGQESKKVLSSSLYADSLSLLIVAAIASCLRIPGPCTQWAQKSFEGREQSECFCVQVASFLVIIYKDYIKSTNWGIWRIALSCADGCTWPWPSLRKVQATLLTSLYHCWHKNSDESELMWAICRYCRKPHGKDSSCEFVVSRQCFLVFFFLLCNSCPQASLNRDHNAKWCVR